MAANNQGNKQSSGTKNRGFASMDPERQRQIASQGGKAAHEKGTAHEYTSEEARRAGSMSHGNRQSASNSSSSRTSSSSVERGASEDHAALTSLVRNRMFSLIRSSSAVART